jgi:hypothetical protein
MPVYSQILSIIPAALTGQSIMMHWIGLKNNWIKYFCSFRASEMRRKINK